jgi:hypothetical protein
MRREIGFGSRGRSAIAIQLYNGAVAEAGAFAEGRCRFGVG